MHSSSVEMVTPLSQFYRIGLQKKGIKINTDIVDIDYTVNHLQPLTLMNQKNNNTKDLIRELLCVNRD